MSESTQDLIHRLAQDAPPVRRLNPPLIRAGVWLAAIAILSGAAVAWLADVQMFVTRASDPRQTIELAATLATGILAVVASFEMSLPDRSRAWALLPTPSLALWIATSGLGCFRSWVDGAPFDLVESSECFAFIVGMSLPLGFALLWMLRRAKPLAPMPVAAMGGLGVAGIAAFLLQFFHPFDVTVIDLVFHAVAVTLVVTVSARSNRVVAE